MQNGTSVGTNESAGPGRERDWQEEKVPLLVCLLANTLVALLSNGALAFAVCTSKSLRKMHNVFYLNLATADLVTVVVMVLATASLFVDRLQLNETVCDAWLALEFCAVMAVLLSIEALTANIHLQISAPFRYKRLVRHRCVVLCIVAAIWLVSVLAAGLPIALQWHLTSHVSPAFVTGGDSWLTRCHFSFNLPYAAVTSGLFVLHLAVILVLNARLYSYARKQQLQIEKFETVSTNVAMQLVKSSSLPPTVRKQINFFGLEIDSRRLDSLVRQHTPTHNCSSSYGNLNAARSASPVASHLTAPRYVKTKRLKAIKTLTIMVLNFFLCWCPFFAVIMCNSVCNGCLSDQVGIWVKMLAFINASSNPIIYTVSNKQLRDTLLKLVRRRFSGSYTTESRSTHSFDFDYIMPYKTLTLTLSEHQAASSRAKTQSGSTEFALKETRTAGQNRNSGLLRRTSSCGHIL